MGAWNLVVGHLIDIKLPALSSRKGLCGQLAGPLRVPQLGLGGAINNLNASLRPLDILQDPITQNLWDSAFTFDLGRFGFNNETTLEMSTSTKAFTLIQTCLCGADDEQD